LKKRATGVEKTMAKIAVLGHGVVGSGVCQVVESNQKSIFRRAGQPIEVKRILDLRDFDVPYKEKFTKNFDDILNDGEISIVVEVMGGLHPAYEYSVAALERGKSVVTSNKELVAAKGAALLRIAREHGCNYFFEASVGGGIPIIRPMHMCLAANEIDEIAGILNGTTNFILTKMIKDGIAFSEALRLAQELGYAERDPSADVEGKDACRKICILASLAFGRQVQPENVPTQGITGVTLEDVAYAENWGGVIKLIASARRRDDDKVECRVSPAFVHNGSQLASIDDVYNGVLVRGNATGDVIFYGKGAGKLPTASAVVADVIDEAKAPGTSKSLTWIESEENIVADPAEAQSDFYVRLRAPDMGVAKQAVRQLFGDVRTLSRPGCGEEEAAFLSGVMPEGELQNKLLSLTHQNIDVLAKIRIVDY